MPKLHALKSDEPQPLKVRSSTQDLDISLECSYYSGVRLMLLSKSNSAVVNSLLHQKHGTGADERHSSAVAPLNRHCQLIVSADIMRLP